jgi:CRISPR-associated protein Cmr2
MTFDYYAALHDEDHAIDGGGRVWNLASGFVDRAATDRAHDDAEGARKYYQERITEVTLSLPPLDLDTDWTPVIPEWFSLSVEFELLTPWYSKDDRPFHVLDNPLRKDRVFGVPFMSAASWKGLLRWACRMEAGLLSHLEDHGNTFDKWRDPEWILHLFGNEKGGEEDFNRGALAFRPTWFEKVGFEVINPHDRSRRAGTVPIVYEVVPPGTGSVLRLLYAPRLDESTPPETFERLFGAIDKLLTVYGFSAKRTAGWGLAKIKHWKVSGVGGASGPHTSCEGVLGVLSAESSHGGAT